MVRSIIPADIGRPSPDNPLISFGKMLPQSRDRSAVFFKSLIEIAHVNWNCRTHVLICINTYHRLPMKEPLSFPPSFASFDTPVHPCSSWPLQVLS